MLSRTAVVILVLFLVSGGVPLLFYEGGDGFISSPVPGSDEHQLPITTRAGPGPKENPHLYHSEAGARWLISIAVEPSPGQYKWYESDLHMTNFYLEQSVGAAGIGKFFLSVYQETGNTSYLEYAEGAARWLISQRVDTAPDAAKWSVKEGLTGTNDYAPDYYGGIGAILEFFLWLYQETGNTTYLVNTEKGANFLLDDAVAENGGYKWQTYYTIDYNMTGFYHGTAGIAFVLKELYEETLNTTYMDYAEGAADWLISIANETGPGERAWVRVQGDPSPNKSWCGGTTGIVHFFLEMFKTTGDTKYLDQARAGGNWTVSNAIDLGSGNKSIEYNNIYCHGDPTDALILLELYNATQDAGYLGLAEEVLHWMISQKVDVNAQEVKWPHLVGGSDYIIGLMMGNSGIGLSLLESYKITGNTTYLELAKRSAGWIENRSIEISPGVEKWNYKEKIDVDEEYCTGWYWGMAGIGEFLMEMVPYWIAPPPEYGVRVNSGDLTGEVLPNQNITYQFYVENTGDTIDTINPTFFNTYDGWKIQVDFDGSGMAPGESRMANATIVFHPYHAGANKTYTVWFASDANSSIVDSINLTTVVGLVHGVNILSGDQEVTIPPGQTAYFELDVRNDGNDQDSFPASFEQVSSKNSTGNWNETLITTGEAVDAHKQFVVYFNVTPSPNQLSNASRTYNISIASGGNGTHVDYVHLSVNVGPVYSIEFPQNFTVTADPGDQFDFTIPVYDHGNDPDDLVVDVKSMPGWNISWELVKTGQWPLMWKFFINVSVPQDAPAGQVGFVKITASSQGDINIWDAFELNVVVNEVFGLEMTLPDNETGVPSEVVAYDLFMRNAGNGPESFNITAVSVNGWEFTFKNTVSNVYLKSGESFSFRIAVTIPQEALAYEFDLLHLNVSSTAETDVFWAFEIRTGTAAVFSLDMTAEPLWQTTNSTSPVDYGITILNLGNIKADVNITVSGARSGWAELLQGSLVDVDSRQNATLTLRITPQGNDSGNFSFILTAAGPGNANASTEVFLNYQIAQSQPGDDDVVDDDDDDDDDDTGLSNAAMTGLIVLLLVILLVIVVLIVFFILRNRKGGAVEKGPDDDDRDDDGDPDEEDDDWDDDEEDDWDDDGEDDWDDDGEDDWDDDDDDDDDEDDDDEDFWDE